ncbi:MAG: ABC transporter substrate-binding protein [Pseudomonadota bacterium]
MSRASAIFARAAFAVMVFASFVLSGLAHAAPQRVVSVNLCTDQLAMLLASEQQLHAVSHLASDADTSILAAKAKRYRSNHGFAEEVFLMRPDLVFAGTFTSRATVSILRRLGIRVEEFAPANSFADIRANLLRMGRLLAREREAEAVVEEFDAALAATAEKNTEAKNKKPVAALYYSNNYTSGSGTLAAEIIERADIDNLASNIGIVGTVKLPLEVLVTENPDVVVTGKRYGPTGSRASEVLGHPALNGLARGSSQAVVQEKYWVCGLPFALEAVKRLRRAVHQPRGGTVE